MSRSMCYQLITSIFFPVSVLVGWIGNVCTSY
uniref:Uncharacterized protein n=1 Tax=Rhizophora mucronata TaxID=61149 RepID=A0A2P2ILJ3_RHIMU